MSNKVTKIFWTGFMAAGKSKLGRRLAQELEWDFIDLDHRIEQDLGPISEIFRQKGEPFFREKESEYLRDLPGGKAVVSTGGGTASHADNMDFMLNRGLVIFADTPFETIWKRLEANGSSENRPMASRKTKDQLRELFQQRYSTYLQSHMKYRPDDNWEEFVKNVKGYLH
jgi:shikimate kinase